MTSLRWGLLSTAAIGRLVVEATRGSDTTEFVAVASRDGAKAEAFARANELPLAFGSYEEMLASDALDAVYVALPISMHAEWTVKALEADLRMVASTLLENGVLGQLDVGLTHTRRDELELVGSAGSLVVPDPWIGVSSALELRRGTKHETIPVDLPAVSRLGRDEGAVYRLELDLVSRAALSGSPLPFGRADAVAQAATLEALDASARSGSPVLLRPGPASSGPGT